MEQFKEGQKVNGPCEKCKAIVPCTLRYCTLQVQGVDVPRILCGVCDKCGTVGFFPHQEVPKIKKYLEDRAQAMRRIRGLRNK